MTAIHQPETKSSSRRALLAGALGGIGALAASAIGRASPVRAGVDGDVVLGSDLNTATTLTRISNTSNGSPVLWAQSSSGTGVLGTSSSDVGVVGSSNSDVGVRASSSSSIGLYGTSTTTTGVLGASGVAGPAARAKTGVYGYAAQDNLANGVFGESPAGRAIVGYSATGYAGYFSGKVYTNRWFELSEISTPTSPSANRARLFVRDSAGKTQLAVKFPNGTVRVLATEA